MDKSKRKQLYKLLDEWTRAEIIARHKPFSNLEFGDYFMIKLEKEHEMRELLYGSSNLVKLGLDWGLLKETRKRKHGKFKKNKTGLPEE